MSVMFPAFLDLHSRRVVVVGGGQVAASKIESLRAAGARVTVIAPDIRPEIEQSEVEIIRREFVDADLDGAWWVVAAAPPSVNRRVSAAAEGRHIFVNAVDDPAHATAYLGGVVRRGGVTIAISTDGRAPALAGLLREALDAWLPREIDEWLNASDEARGVWRKERTPMEQRRPQLLDILNRLYEEKRRTATVRIPDPGSRPAPRASVALVGAGPGDPELWTQRALAWLAAADLVLYDALVDAQALRRFTNAQCFCVGKRARRESVRQETIHRLMIRAARAGKRVVRLKGGDPFVFGRGAEEALALAMAGVAFEVVPGVSSAIAAPELAGIPVTHRGLASGFLVLSGHAMESFAQGAQAVQPNTVPLIVLMGVGSRDQLAQTLIAQRWNPATPAAIVCGASTSDEWVWTGTIAELGHADVPAGIAGVLVIGEVVRVRESLRASAIMGCAAGAGDERRPEQSEDRGNEVKYGRH
jgi:uroporphyrin-III C-methyltransferase / precorrin-2 dehydrogenase / sirohydrochlorin ferrochelatase